MWRSRAYLVPTFTLHSAIQHSADTSRRGFFFLVSGDETIPRPMSHNSSNDSDANEGGIWSQKFHLRTRERMLQVCSERYA